MKHLAFDFGASSGRAILGSFDGEKIELTEIHRFLNEPVEINGTLYWDSLRLFHELKQGLLKAQQAGHDGITSIGIDTWGVDFGLIDKNGDLIGSPVHYRDSRTDGIMQESFETIPRQEQYKLSGLQFMQFNTLYQLLALKKNSPHLLENADKAIFMPDLFNYFLTGEKVCESTIASTSQLCNPSTHNFAPEIFDAFGIKADLFPKMVTPGTITGKIRDSIKNELGLKYDPVVISVAQHDTASAVMAVPAQTDKFAYISSGTWSLLGSETPIPYTDETALQYNFTNEGGYGNTTRLLKNIMGLWIIQECKRQWDRKGEVFSFGELASLAQSCEPLKCFIDPDDPLFMPPNGMVDRIQKYCAQTGQYVPTTHGEISRCIYESLAMKYRMSLEGLEQILGYTLPVLHIVGGGCQNKALCQYTANAIGRPVVAGPVEATAIGNIACQLIAMGEIKDLSDARRIIGNSFDSIVYQPQDTEIWDEKYNTFKTIIKN